jgi:two-component system, NarL family, response regulator DesR
MQNVVAIKRALLIDSHPICRFGLISLLQLKYDIVGEADTGASAHELLERINPDLIILDPSLSDMDGIDLLQRWLANSWGGQICILTSRDASHEINRALALGVHGYMLKTAPLNEIVAGIELVAGGGRFVTGEVVRKSDYSAAQVPLTTREQEVLLWLARGYSYDGIGKQLSVQTETVRSHTKNIMGKLAMKSRSEAVALALRSGLIRLDEL